MEISSYEVWVNFYQSFANRLLAYKKNRSDLIELVYLAYEKKGMKVPTLDSKELIDIDPFTVFGLFNKGISIKNRISLIEEFAKLLSITEDIPTTFEGIPILNNLSSTFYSFQGEREDSDIQNLWNVFECAILYADEPSDTHRQRLEVSYDIAVAQRGVKWNLTIGLYWIRPYVFINLDGLNRSFLKRENSEMDDVLEIFPKLKTNHLPNGKQYIELSKVCKNVIESGDFPYKNIPEMSHYVWLNKESQEESTISTNVDSLEEVSKRHYWIYGERSIEWEQLREKEFIFLEWEKLGDISKYPSKDSLKRELRSIYGENRSFMNIAHSLWQFSHDLNKGDIVYIKTGSSTLVARGLIDSDYIYDEQGVYTNIRKVRWTHIGEWEHPGRAVAKLLTDITPYSDYVEKLEQLFIGDEEQIEEELITYPIYEKEDFLSEVYMSDESYEVIKNLLIRKKNIILQGAPGVGKTFAAKRLAYSVMGEVDPNRVQMLQFHQSYSYEDFVMGFRPNNDNETPFKLVHGAFYKFCKEAQKNQEKDYFFIIDEINRGNLSKIFGELFMLIEHDKRSEKNSIRLLYENEQFYIPSNIHIIGMMNTADRSLAMLDYALRRRFAFFELVPAFHSQGFKQYQSMVKDSRFDKLIEIVKVLNDEIGDDSSLGAGFQIGHSYFIVRDTSIIDEEWLKSLVRYELIPLLKEYWFDEPSKVEKWSSLLHGAIQ